jgi:beta-glucanase (GH16 family)
MPLDQERTRAVPSHRRQGSSNLSVWRRWNLARRPRTVIGVIAAVAVIVIGLVGVAIKEATNGPGLPTAATPSGWQMTFNSNFSGNTLDSKIWSTCYWWASSNGCTDNPTVEKEWYLPSQVHVNGGVLQLVAQPEATQGEAENGKAKEYSCRSGMVSNTAFNFTYGLIQIVAKIPYGPGLWPALWLAASSHQWPPELDIMEHWGSDQKAKVYDHATGVPTLGGPVATAANLSDGWHTFSLLWTKTGITWYIDGVTVYSTKTDIPHQSMHFIADLADNTSGPGTCSGTMNIQSVKVWQPAST